MSDVKTPEVGQVVIFCDSKGVDHNALVTTVWSPECLNVVVVSDNEKEQDGYGRQTKHVTSLPHMAPHLAHGYYFRYADEDKQEYKGPLAS